RKNVEGYTPELMAPICGIDADTIREVARLFATSKASMILWGMGISQHVHGTDNARCLIALSLMTGQIGRPGTGLHPLRGQNNVQGASDAGLIPMMYPDYQRVSDQAARERFEQAWGVAREGRLIIQQIAQRLGLDWRYSHVSEVFDEMRHTMPSIAGITWDRLEREHAVTYPCRHEGDPGESVVFVDDFPRDTGRAHFVPADIIPADERPDAEYPMVLITGRQLEHWHT